MYNMNRLVCFGCVVLAANIICTAYCDEQMENTDSPAVYIDETEPDETAPPTIPPKHTTDQPNASDKPKLNPGSKTPRPGNSTKSRPGSETAQSATKYEKPRSGFPVSHTLKQKHKSNATSPRISATYVAPADRGVELTFAETGKITVFMMVRGNAFIQLDGEAIPTFQLRLCREISFQFKTRLPHGLLVYHSVKNRPEGSPPYALYIIVEKGQLKVVHVFGKHLTSVTVGKGLNRDMWHSVIVRIDVHGARLLAKVDNESAEINLQGLHVSSNYGIATDLNSVVLIGGLSPEEKIHGVKYIIESFVGCIKDIILSAGKAASDLLPINPLIATKHENVQEGCINKCYTEQNLCFFGSKCINHYSESTCDCFGTLYEGELCDIYTATILTLRGSSYVSYRVYDWKDRVHSSVNRVSLHFKTRFDDSALFYASGEHEKFHYISVSIQNGTVVVEIDLGNAAPLITSLGHKVNCNKWFNLTISHSYNVINVSLNDVQKRMYIEGSMNYLYIDPEIYIAGGPELHKKKGLKSNNYFTGALKYVFFNEISILYELKKGNPKVHYIGLLEPAFGDMDVESIPLTFPFYSSHIWWHNENFNTSGCFTLKFDFRSYKNLAVLAAAEVTTEAGEGYWEVRVVNEEVRFDLVSNVVVNNTQLVSVKYDNTKNQWHSIDLQYCNSELNLTIDFKHKTNHIFGLRFNLSERIIVGSGINGKPNVGLIGCLRNISINDKLLEPRYIVRTNHMVGEVSIDNCQLVDPCKRDNACKHGGKCSIKDDKVHCDCSGTGYVGKNCHFAQFKKTCEELALLGYTKPDVYLIDIDGNGRFPPAHVKCEFQSLEDWKTKTIVEHNLPSQIDVRSSAETDFSFAIKYREFTSEMLSELISHSLNCSQYIKYDCFKAPLELHSATWFISAAEQGTVDYIGNVKRGSCPCAENRTCVDPSLSCNCDVSEEKWLSDEGFFITPSSLGITKMVFLQQKDLDMKALGRITLGPLECVEANTQRYVVTFTTSQSYIEVPGWRKGDIAFSFRTTGEKAILLYQPPIRQHYPSFMVVLTSDFELTFNFTLNTGDSREMEIKSQRRLNSGEWQKIWIDYNKHHVRFMINTDYQMVDLRPHEEFGPFEGSMFIGGAVDTLVVKGSVYPGLVGCFRGLVVNGEILDIYSYMSVHLSEIIKECKPKCDPNPCMNGAKCKELWNRFECVCENAWAYAGTYCEENINTGGITSVIRESFLKKSFLLDNVTEPEKVMFANMLKSTLLLNIRTYDQNSLILYVNDHLNNFVQLYIEDGKTIVFLYNYGNEIKNVSVEYPNTFVNFWAIGLNNGKSTQLAIVRTENTTTLHVNEFNRTSPFGIKLLAEYSNKPWINPHTEVLSPQRPPAPPTEYLQVNIAGYDPYNLLSVNNQTKLLGYVGCIRGLKIANNVTKLITPLNNATNNTEIEGILVGCRMKCDGQPCKNQGICIEDFQKGESKCDCEHTSYYGDHCNLEKGADFSGESVLQRKFVLEGPVRQIKVQLAFSSSDKREKKTALLLLQTVNMRSYYLLVALGAEGELIIEEDREGSMGAYGIHINDRSFLNGARHSVYYKRIENTTTLLVDRVAVSVGPIPYLSFSNDDEAPTNTVGDNEVQIGGVNTSDPRFGSYKSYSGCLSNVFIEVNNNSMKPLDEYMLFTKAGSEKVNITNSQGVRSAQCAFFDVMHKPQSSPSLNISFAEEQAWVEDPPERVQYTSFYADTSEEEESASTIIFILSSSILAVLLVTVAYHSYVTNQKWKRRKEQETEMEIRRSKRQSLQYQETVLSTPLIVVSYKPTMSHEDDSKRVVINGVDSKPAAKQTLTIPQTKYYKLSDKDDAENEIREYKEKDRSKIIRNRNRNDRDLKMYESIEEVAELHEESTNELCNGDFKKVAVKVKEIPNSNTNRRLINNDVNENEQNDLLLYKKYKMNDIMKNGDSGKNYNIDEMGSLEFTDNPYS